MKKNEKFGLTENEYKLICDFMEGRLIDFDCSKWREDFYSDLLGLNQYADLERKFKVKISKLIKKLESLSEIEFIEMISSTLFLWCSGESVYIMSGKITPSKKIEELSKNNQCSLD